MLIYIRTDNEFVYRLQRVEEELHWVYIGRNGMGEVERIQEPINDASISEIEMLCRTSGRLDKNRWEDDSSFYITYPYQEGDL